MTPEQIADIKDSIRRRITAQARIAGVYSETPQFTQTLEAQVDAEYQRLYPPAP